MKIKNKHIYGDQEMLNRLEEEYRGSGFSTLNKPGHLTIYAVDQDILRARARAEEKRRNRKHEKTTGRREQAPKGR
jgi:hypothetical protein